jgi:hypothetical protein
MLTRFRVPVVGGAVALLLGIAIALWGATLTGPDAGWIPTAFSLAVPYLLAGLVLGAIWPEGSGAWGAWLILPLGLLLLLSLGFSGQVGAFVRHDLAPLLAAVAAAVVGGVVGGRARRAWTGTGREAGA